MKRPRLGLISNAAASYAGQFIIQGVGFLLTPLLIVQLGEVMYGVWLLIVAVQGLAGLLDLGVGPSVVKYVAEHHARDETAEMNRVVATSFALHLAVGILACAATWALARFGVPLLRLEGAQAGVAQQGLIIAGWGLLVGLPLAILGNVLTGLRHYEIANAINIVQALASAGAIVLVLRLGYGPVALVAINAAGLALAHAVKAVAAFRLRPGLCLDHRAVSRSTLRRIGGYSVWLFLLDAAKRLFANADTVLIAAFLPIGAVTTYSLGFKPASAIAYLSGPLVSVFFPAASALAARDDDTRLQRLLLEGTRVTLLLTLPALLWLLAFGRQALDIWVGPGHEASLPILNIFLAVFLLSTFQNPAGTILRGIGQVRALALIVVAEYAVNIGVSLLLIPRIGISGAALGTLLPLVVSNLLIVPRLACGALGIPYREFLRQTWRGPALAAFPTGTALWLLGRAAPATLPAIVAGAVMAVLLFGLVYLALPLDHEEQRRVRGWLTAARAGARPPIG